MTRTLPEKPNLEFLKREAKRILKSAREGKTEYLALLRADEKFASASDDEIAAAVTLLDVQHSLARDYGSDGWPAMKSFVESQVAVLDYVRPVLKVGNFDEAVAHYVDWLGFNLDWEWREAPGQPAIGAMSRDNCAFMVNEHPGTLGPTALHLDVKNLDALVAEWNERRPGAVSAEVSPPYEFKDVPITDPWGNVVVFEGKDEASETKKRDAIRPRMRAYIEQCLETGKGFPTPEEVREVIGPPLGTAIEVLNEFEGYREAFEARQHPD